MNGKLKLPLRTGKYFTVFGGPYRDRPANMRGVKMAREIKTGFDVSIPTDDYSTPDLKDLTTGLLEAVDLILSGQAVYVGCMGGFGRTGLFLAILAKAFRVKSPVPYVRRKYYPQAVETPEQYKFVTHYRIPAEVRRKIKIARIKSYFNPLQWFGANLTHWNGNETKEQPVIIPAEVGWVAKGKALANIHAHKYHQAHVRITEVPKDKPVGPQDLATYVTQPASEVEAETSK